MKHSNGKGQTTVNNIVINNFGSENTEAPSSKIFFPPLESVKLSRPTVEQADELAKVT